MFQTTLSSAAILNTSQKKLGVCPHQLQTVSSGVLDGKLWQKHLTCSILIQIFFIISYHRYAAVWS